MEKLIVKKYVGNVWVVADNFVFLFKIALQLGKNTNEYPSLKYFCTNLLWLKYVK